MLLRATERGSHLTQAAEAKGPGAVIPEPPISLFGAPQTTRQRCMPPHVSKAPEGAQPGIPNNSDKETAREPPRRPKASTGINSEPSEGRLGTEAADIPEPPICLFGARFQKPVPTTATRGKRGGHSQFQNRVEWHSCPKSSKIQEDSDRRGRENPGKNRSKGPEERERPTQE